MSVIFKNGRAYGGGSGSVQTQNNLTTTDEGYALDARQGNVLDTRISTLETPTFTQASSRANIESGENTPTILGKIKKYFADLKSHAFNSTVNNLTTTTTGYALDATQGKALKDEIDTLNSNSFTDSIDINPEYVNSGHSSNGIAYKFGNTVIIHAFFASATFMSGVPLFFVPEGYRPSATAIGLIKCKRLSEDELYTKMFTVEIDTNGNICQRFNSDGAGAEWQGEIFICYNVS